MSSEMAHENVSQPSLCKQTKDICDNDRCDNDRWETLQMHYKSLPNVEMHCNAFRFPKAPFSQKESHFNVPNLPYSNPLSNLRLLLVILLS